MFIEDYLNKYGTTGHDKLMIALLLSVEAGEPIDQIVKDLGTHSADLRAMLDELEEKQNAT